MNLSKIETMGQFEQFTKNSKLFAKNIILSLETLDDKKNVYYSKVINENKNACGCETGTVFMVMSILITIFLIVSNYQVFKIDYLINTLYGIGFIFCFSIIGKLFGLSIAKFKLNKALKEIKNISQQRV